MTMENLPASERQVLEDAPQEPSRTKSINLLSDNVQEPQYVMEVSSNDGHLPSAVIRINSSSSLSSDVQICRICHEFANEDEDLLSPCECSGTLGTVHRSCLEQWLAASNTSRCELCQFEFALERMARPLNEWLRDPALHHERRTLFGDFICFLFITPLAGLSGWLCVQGAVDHLYFSSSMEAVGLIVLTSALITIYLFWTIVSFRYHIRLFREWRRSNQNVRLLIPRPQVLLSNQPNPLLAQKSSKLQSKETIV